MTVRNIDQILVTGGAGFMGSDFIRYVLEKKLFSGKVVNLDLLTYASNLANVHSCEANERYEFIQGDICDRALVEKLFQKYRFSAVVHFAAESHVDRSIEDPEAFMRTNVMGTYTLLEVVRSYKNCHFHHISTDEVYGELFSEGVFTEESPYAPSSPYSASKASSDLLVLSYARTFGLSATISHATNNFGPGQNGEKLIPKMVSAALRGEEMPIYGSGKNVRQWLFVRDHSIAVGKLLLKGRPGEIYNIAGVAEKTNNEVVAAIIQQVSAEIKRSRQDLEKLICYIEDRPGHDFRYALDGTKMREEINWTPLCSFEEGLSCVIKERVNECKDRLCYPGKA